MRRWIFHCVGVAALLACLALVFAFIVSHWRTLRGEAKLPGGIVLAADDSGGDLRCSITRWGAESREWWRARRGMGPMTVTGKTVTISGPTLYATELNVDLGSSQWHGVRWRQGAVSRNPLTTSAGAMSTPLVPYRSVSVPWFYPLVVLGTVAIVWVALVARRARRRRTRGHCAVCGYDLRATPERCPECGSEQAGARTTHPA